MPAHAAQTVGLFQNSDQSQQGYTLLAPVPSTLTYLLNPDGRPVRTWTSPYTAGLAAYFLDSGHLLRAASLPTVDPHFVPNAGGGGRFEEYDWDGNLVWSYEYSNSLHLSHHDFKKLPNGNVLFIAWDYKTQADAIAAGRNPAFTAAAGAYGESVIEVQPVPPSSGNIVWEWHVWDHWIQDFDSLQANFGVVANHPELININIPQTAREADFIHANGVAYNAALDQVIVSFHRYSEVFVIDHSTTSAQAAGHTGGRSGHGGDVLYRWGNPQNYGRGTASDQKFFRQHDPQWIADGLPGAGHIMVFNNGFGRPGGGASSVDEIAPPTPDGNGNYPLPPGGTYAPTSLFWTYMASPPTSFYAQIVSGAQRMPNGNTLTINGPAGDMFEVTSAGTQVWRYVNPIAASGDTPQGTVPTNNLVFKMRRYQADYPGLVGRTLIPGEPIETGFTPPPSIPDGSGGTDPVTAARLTTAGTQIRVEWDTTGCIPPHTNLIYGNLAQVAQHQLLGAQCDIGSSGLYTWTTVPSGSLYYYLVGNDSTGIYESSWGTTRSGAPSAGTRSSAQCSVTTKSTAQACP